MAKKQRPSTDEKLPSFEEALEELEDVVRDLEQGDLGLAAALERYELGIKRLKQCQQLLEQAEQRIEILTRVDAEGNAVTRPLDPQAATKGKSGKAKRKRPVPAKADHEHDTAGDEPGGPDDFDGGLF